MHDVHCRGIWLWNFMRFGHDPLINLVHKAVVEGLWAVDTEAIDLTLEVADLHVLFLEFELMSGS